MSGSIQKLLTSNSITHTPCPQAHVLYSSIYGYFLTITSLNAQCTSLIQTTLSISPVIIFAFTPETSHISAWMSSTIFSNPSIKAHLTCDTLHFTLFPIILLSIFSLHNPFFLSYSINFFAKHYFILFKILFYLISNLTSKITKV